MPSELNRSNAGYPSNYFSKPLLLGVYVLYAVVLGFTIAHHELWGDELHSWNIARASTSFSNLISNTRYEGHPPVWYTMLWLGSKFTHDVHYIQLAQFVIASLVVFVILFYSPFPVFIKSLIPFGYFFLFEYGVLSRNYAVGVLFALLICIILTKNFKNKVFLYYGLLFLLSNTHLIALVLACSLHFYFLLSNIANKKAPGIVLLHLVVGIIVLLPALYFIFPPSDSEMNTHFWTSRLDIKHITALFQPPLYAFVPIPAWWSYNFWNTQFLLEAQSKYAVIKVVTILVLLVALGILFLILRKNKKSLALFATNILLSLVVSVFLPLTEARYAGFIFIGFIAAYWLYCSDTPATRKNQRFVNVLLVIQVFGGCFAVVKDIQFPFSNGYRVTELLNEIPKSNRVVTDYWTLNTLAAYAEKPFYCLELRRETSFLLWNKELAESTQAPDRYSNNLRYLFNQGGIREVYLVSIRSPQLITSLDPMVMKLYNVQLIDKREDAIEKGSNLYLYEINTPGP